MSYFWKPHYRDLKKGDVIRTIVSNKNHPDYGLYWYAIATGGGFGSRISTLGNAIFVCYENRDLSKVLNARKGLIRKMESDGNRWERFWGIEIFEMGDRK